MRGKGNICLSGKEFLGIVIDHLTWSFLASDVWFLATPGLNASGFFELFGKLKWLSGPNNQSDVINLLFLPSMYLLRTLKIDERKLSVKSDTVE